MVTIRLPGGRRSPSRRFSTAVKHARHEIREGHFQRVLILLSLFATVVTGFESYTQHLRGAFSNRWMWTPVVLTLPMALAGGAAILSERVARRVLPVVSLLWILAGIAGFALHIGGIRRIPGGFKLGRYNIVTGPPIFAPLLACTMGFMGVLASLLERGRWLPWLFGGRVTCSLPRQRRIISEPAWLPRGFESAVSHGRFQRGMALATAFFGLLAGGEAYFEHLRGSFNQKVMWTPIWVAPALIAVSLAALFSKVVGNRLLLIVSMVASLEGTLGFILHLQGIRRMPGGYANFSFNIIKGPPLFAPLLFSAAGVLGIIAALMRRSGR